MFFKFSYLCITKKNKIKTIILIEVDNLVRAKIIFDKLIYRWNIEGKQDYKYEQVDNIDACFMDVSKLKHYNAYGAEIYIKKEIFIE